MNSQEPEELTHNHDVVPVVMVTEVEMAASGGVTPGHQRCVLDAWFQDTRCPHDQEAQYQKQELPQTLQQLPAAWVRPPLCSSGQKQLEHPEGSKVHGGWGQSPALCPLPSSPPRVCLQPGGSG